jgi:hypothetical protein
MSDKNRTLVCKHCDEVFSRGSALSTHIMYKHEGYRLEQIECKHGCGTSTHTTSTLVKHETNCWLKPENITHCDCCGVLIERVVSRGDDRKYCGSSCAGKVGNLGRVPTEQHRENARASANVFFDNDPRYRNHEERKTYKSWRAKAHRYSIQQLKDLRKDLYEYWQSNPYTGSGDTSKLSLEHTKPLIECFREGIPIEEAGHINNLEIISYKENNLRYNKIIKSLTSME